MHPGLSRLLNAADGIVGRDSRLIVCITTNERLALLHPALLRAGRCLANIHIGELSPDEVASLVPGARVTEALALSAALQLGGRLQTIAEIDTDPGPTAYV
jgi:hypothetical protein